jgi:hypothetical protein
MGSLLLFLGQFGQRAITSSIEVVQFDGWGGVAFGWRSMKHEPIVIERSDWRVTKAVCSCGAELQLAGDVGSVREQTQKLVVAFRKHIVQKETARQKPIQSAFPKPTALELTPSDALVPSR